MLRVFVALFALAACAAAQTFAVIRSGPVAANAAALEGGFSEDSALACRQFCASQTTAPPCVFYFYSLAGDQTCQTFSSFNTLQLTAPDYLPEATTQDFEVGVVTTSAAGVSTGDTLPATFQNGVPINAVTVVGNAAFSGNARKRRTKLRRERLQKRALRENRRLLRNL